MGEHPRGVLGIIPGEITTRDAGCADRIDVDNDILKIIIAERHNNTRHIGIGYIQGYGLKRGAENGALLQVRGRRGEDGARRLGPHGKRGSP